MAPGATVDVKGSPVDVKGSPVDVKGLTGSFYPRRALLGVRENSGEVELSGGIRSYRGRWYKVLSRAVV
eukprot:6567200-Pyramimonas_sp.AAC.1